MGFKPKLNFDTRQCSACGMRLTQIRPNVEPGKRGQRIWINVDPPHDLHVCEKTVKVYTREEIDALELERKLGK